MSESLNQDHFKSIEHIAFAPLKLRKSLKKRIEQMTADAAINRSKILQSSQGHEKTNAELKIMTEKFRQRELDVTKILNGFKQVKDENEQLKNVAKVC